MEEPDVLDRTYEIDQRLQFVRHTVQIFTTWFTFFGTLNVVVLGWAVTADPALNIRVVILVAVLFIFQNICAHQATTAMTNYLADQNSRLGNLVLQPYIPMPFSFYLKALNLINASFKSFIVIWIIAILILAYLGGDQPIPEKTVP